MRELLRDLGRADTYRDFFEGIWEGVKDPETWLYTGVGALVVGYFGLLIWMTYS